jgi:hypothetical protein
VCEVLISGVLAKSRSDGADRFLILLGDYDCRWIILSEQLMLVALFVLFIGIGKATVDNNHSKHKLLLPLLHVYISPSRQTTRHILSIVFPHS